MNPMNNPVKTGPMPRLKLEDYDLLYERTPPRWLDGVPLGNGYLGAMLWGDGDPLRITLDKPDVWEMRETMRDPERYRHDIIKKLVDGKKWVEINDILYTRPVGCKPADHPFPTRWPLPRMEIENMSYSGGRLGLKTATWQTERWQAFMHATRHLFVLKGMTGKEHIKVDYVAKDDPSITPDIRSMGDFWGWQKECMAGWGYPSLERGEKDGIAWVRQVMPGSGEFVIAWRIRGDELLLTVQTQRDAPSPLEKAAAILSEAPASDLLRKEHEAWWRKYWKRSSISIPDKRLENRYYAELYKMGSCSRPDGWAMPLCGVWMHDGCIGYCWSEYALDWNVQAAYWLAYPSNHLELVGSLVGTFDKMMPRFRDNCRAYYGIEGLWTSAAIGLDGIVMNGIARSGKLDRIGWEPLVCLPSMLPWLSHNYWLYYRFSGDVAFLKEKVVPLLKGCWRVYAHVLEKGADGKWHLPIAHSPEYMECRPEVWQKDTSFDAALIRYICHGLLEAERVLAEPDPDHGRYEDILANLYDYPGGDELWIADGLPLSKSHRHHCHMMGVYPLEELTIEGSERDRKRISNSLMRVQTLGTGEWCGHGFTAHALVAARAGYAEMAWNWLQQTFFLIGPNTIGRAGDPRRFGITRFTNELMSVDAGFSAAAALLEMLLQSWGGIIRVFPAVPEFWADVSFRGLLAEGAFEVSSEKRNGHICWIELKSLRGGTARVKNVFNGAVRVGAAAMSGDVLDISMEPGQTIRLEPVDGIPRADDMSAGQRVQGKHWFGLKQIARF